jgi:Virulence activator alpha C-term
VIEHVERFREQAATKLSALQAIAAQPVSNAGEELPRMTLRQGLAGTEVQLRWAEEILPDLYAHAASRRATRRRSPTR